MKNKQKKEMQKHIHDAMREMIKDKEKLNKMKHGEMVPFMVDRVCKYVAKKMGLDEYYVVYTMMFDHLWFEYLDMKLILKQGKSQVDLETVYKE